MLKIGVLGAGHLGKIHLKCIKQTDKYELAGFYDADTDNASKVEKDLSVKSFDTIDELIDQVDVVDIVTPTLSHFDCASKALKKFRHVFIEKPVVTTPEEARLLIDLAEEAGVKVQVGHVERFNPAFIAASPYIENPMFIETHRLAQFNPRGTDVPVILDLMIHDLDIVLSIVKANIRKVSASGVAVVSDTPDIANARIEFDNGCVANLTASRISMKNMRKSRFFQRDAYIAVDFLDKKTEIIRMRGVDPATADPMAMILDLGPGKLPKQILFDQPEVKPLNAIQTELESFADAINNNTPPPVTINDGYAALDLAYRIISKMNSAANLI
ncbi:Gfo/Idh/MocA family oxidoreductase [Lentimicrobium sp.]|jgi:predicted dehydrogenase|uniref:Gfo/Idh/MocA family protein n=1 Tax=Lentimicrobium sp. TaxID=2034841 RepID=UPI002BAFE05F|nr:Gfo/Idh/MocA family oxidoreductase [Lentimicrobium sp.]MCO5263120.1 Gfo/Idh/MocA family oxidoreductase [Lentimicrobium sp.]HOP14838.1 Gfo/Idh/MocA family oxidoreductase [Lentimicrobium sp.]HPF65915.1 Gfo/Idh/MocA family oxidoreductase [Lentimicrobium sp.]HPJ63735.1 Gfo/Idh/MocA family oxidoreductase [Lentimicrobium sp.]HPR27506.1 Gfo/Idh/MocA family oxidoreductase [Lentimicrobium sp.]